MFAVGHLALGYLIGKSAQKLLKTNTNLPAIFFLALISDADLILPGVAHRTATHSLIISTLAFIPAFMLLRRSSLPYFAALIQHPLLGDSLTNTGSQLFWPLSRFSSGLGLAMHGWEIITIEWISFLIAMLVLVRSGDLRILFAPHKTTLLLLVPLGAILLSAILGFSYAPPPILLFPHFAFLGIFAVSILSFVRQHIPKK